MGTTLEWLLELLYNELGEINEEDYKRFTEELALLRRLATIGAESQIRGEQFDMGGWSCKSCGRSNNLHGQDINMLHAYNCDAAKFLKLKREAEK